MSWPTLPVDLAPLQAALEAVVREIQRTFFNRSPVAVVSTPVTGADGDITGSVIGSDAEDDPLSYSVVRGPSAGTVTLNPDGSFTYAPSETHQRTGGVDSFVVAVTDTGQHLHLFNGDGSAQATVSVFTEANGEDPGNLGATRGFNVYNLSSSTVRFDHYDGDKPAEAPPVGTAIAPGQYAHFEVTYYFADRDEVRAWFGSDSGAYFSASMTVTPFTGFSFVKCSAGGAAECGPTQATEASTIRLFDPPGTVVHLTDGQQQAEVLKALCEGNPNATCTFKATEEEKIMSEPPKQFGSAIRNTTDSEQQRTIEVTETQTYTNNIQWALKAGWKITELINLELTTTFGHTWTNTHTYTEKMTITLKPFTESLVFAENPLYRDWGTFTVKMGNTTWVIENVYFDSPIANEYPTYTITSRPISPSSV